MAIRATQVRFFLLKLEQYRKKSKNGLGPFRRANLHKFRLIITEKAKEETVLRKLRFVMNCLNFYYSITYSA